MFSQLYLHETNIQNLSLPNNFIMFYYHLCPTGYCSYWNSMAELEWWTSGNFSQLHVRWHNVGSLKLAMVGVFISGKLENTTNQDLTVLLKA